MTSWYAYSGFKESREEKTWTKEGQKAVSVGEAVIGNLHKPIIWTNDA